LQTDVWNITTRPSENNGIVHIATAAEDFTSKIFEIDLQKQTYKELACLTGHKRAVTGIQWIYLPDG